MKTLISILILLSFLQETIIPIDFVLIVLILRAYLKVDSTNLYLSLIFGVLISFLEHVNLSIYAFLYLILIEIVHIFSRLPVNRNFIMVIPLVFVALVSKDLSVSFIFHQTPNLFPKVLIETILSIPIYFILRIWEERFIVRKDVKLRI